MDAVEIGSASEHLRLSAEPDDPAFDHLVACLSVDGLSATKRVYSHYASGWREFADFFSRLAADWRGWSGTREWTSLESDLKIEARHEYGHVQLRVTLGGALAGWGNHGWRASADITLEPGEQLSRVADELRELVSTSSGTHGMRPPGGHDRPDSGRVGRTPAALSQSASRCENDVVLRRYASWYGTQSPLVMAVWVSVITAIAAGWCAWEIVAADDVAKGLVGFVIWVVAFCGFAAASFALVVHYEVPYFKGSLRDYMRERKDGSQST